MRIALIKPPGDFVKSGLGAKKYLRSGNLPPLGLAYLAAALEQAGHRPIIIDSPARELGVQEIEQILADFFPDALGITLQILDFEIGLALAHKLREKFPVPLILGGPHLTSSYQNLLPKISPPAYLVRGEGESTLPELITKLSRNDFSPDLPGVLFYDRDKNLTGIPDPVSVPNLDTYPVPAYHLYSPAQYRPLPSYSRRLPALTMITSRGCPYRKCTFCFQSLATSPSYRRHSPGRVINEIDYLTKNQGIREIYFVDDIFTINNHWLEEFCGKLIEKKIPVDWVCYGKADLVNPQILKLMKAAGCFQVKFGFESGIPGQLDFIEKGFTLEQVRRANTWVKEAGLEVNASFILGLPGETPDQGEQTIRWALELDPDFAEFFPCHPLPGTRLFSSAQKMGWFADSTGQKGIHEPSFVPAGYPGAESLRALVKSAYTRFYLRPGYIFKTLRKCRSRDDFARYRNGFKLFRGLT